MPAMTAEEIALQKAVSSEVRMQLSIIDKRVDKMCQDQFESNAKMIVNDNERRKLHKKTSALIEKDALPRRDKFAMAAMQGMLASEVWNIFHDHEECSEASIKFADELIKQLDGGE